MLKGQIGQDFSPPQSLSPIMPQPSGTEQFQVNIPNVEQLKQQWEQNRTVNIPNLFPDLQANNLWEYYYSRPDDWWQLPISPDPYFDYNQSRIDDPGYYHMYYSSPNDPSYKERLDYIHKVNNEGGFSYIYRRTTKERHGHFTNALAMFEARKFIKLLEYITGYDNLIAEKYNLFVSCYSEGHYNGPHIDGDNGRLAFVYHLSKDWKPEYGGLFMRMDWDWKTVNKVVVPPFNTLTLFDTKWEGKKGSPHMVTEIAQGCNNKRISYTGWFLL